LLRIAIKSIIRDMIQDYIKGKFKEKPQSWKTWYSRGKTIRK